MAKNKSVQAPAHGTNNQDETMSSKKTARKVAPAPSVQATVHQGEDDQTRTEDIEMADAVNQGTDVTPIVDVDTMYRIPEVDPDETATVRDSFAKIEAAYAKIEAREGDSLANWHEIGVELKVVKDTVQRSKRGWKPYWLSKKRKFSLSKANSCLRIAAKFDLVKDYLKKNPHLQGKCTADKALEIITGPPKEKKKKQQQGWDENMIAEQVETLNMMGNRLSGKDKPITVGELVSAYEMAGLSPAVALRKWKADKKAATNKKHGETTGDENEMLEG